MADEDDYITVIDGAIRDGIQACEPGTMVTKWVFGAEVIDPEGQRCCWTVAAPENKKWDTIGLIAFLNQCEVGTGD